MTQEERDEQKGRVEQFVEYLYGLASDHNPLRRPDRAALAQLRRGLQSPGLSAETLRHVAPYLPDGPGEERYARERAAFLTVGALFGFHPKALHRGRRPENLGDIMHQLGHHESAEGRFTTLLNARVEGIPPLLRQVVSLAKAADLPLDYHRLLLDLLAWDTPERRVQLNWARSYWRRREEAGRAAGVAADTTEETTDER